MTGWSWTTISDVGVSRFSNCATGQTLSFFFLFYLSIHCSSEEQQLGGSGNSSTNYLYFVLKGNHTPPLIFYSFRIFSYTLKENTRNYRLPTYLPTTYLLHTFLPTYLPTYLSSFLPSYLPTYLDLSPWMNVYESILGIFYSLPFTCLWVGKFHVSQCWNSSIKTSDSFILSVQLGAKTLFLSSLKYLWLSLLY